MLTRCYRFYCIQVVLTPWTTRLALSPWLDIWHARAHFHGGTPAPLFAGAGVRLVNFVPAMVAKLVALKLVKLAI
jgi:hypothetical protein